jgi:hypothetical protein
MIRLIADALIELPFKLDFCAQGPDVDPLTCEIERHQATIFFPPSLSDGTDGQGVFGDWAWWTGKSIRLILERDVDSVEDADTLRTEALAVGNEVLRRFLNSYRYRMNRPDVHPIKIDPRVLNLKAVGDEGKTFELPEPFSSFFYKSMPKEAPLDKSVNAQTLALFADDVRNGQESPMIEQLRLDAELLEAQGEIKRAAKIREIL